MLKSHDQVGCGCSLSYQWGEKNLLVVYLIQGLKKLIFGGSPPLHGPVWPNTCVKLTRYTDNAQYMSKCGHAYPNLDSHSEFGSAFRIGRCFLNQGTLICKHYAFRVPIETKGEQAPQLTDRNGKCGWAVDSTLAKPLGIN